MGNLLTSQPTENTKRVLQVTGLLMFFICYSWGRI